MCKGDVYYYARVNLACDIFEVIPLTMRTVESDYCVGIYLETKQAFLFFPSNIGDILFETQEEARLYIKNYKKGVPK